MAKPSSSARERVAAWAAGQLGVSFRRMDLLERALTHKSLGRANYERLEFLGDRVLGLAIADWLFRLFPNEPEGRLNSRFARLVSRETCARIARTLDLGEQLNLGTQARQDGGADSDNILGDTLEALIGAVYLEGGMAAAEPLIRKLWKSEVDRIAEAPKHPKSAVQELAAARRLKEPCYTLLGRAGPHHAPLFRVQLEVAPLPPVTAEGSSKQEAETRAAETFLTLHRPDPKNAP